MLISIKGESTPSLFFFDQRALSFTKRHDYSHAECVMEESLAPNLSKYTKD
jgi:hypothetical protein